MKFFDEKLISYFFDHNSIGPFIFWYNLFPVLSTTNTVLTSTVRVEITTFDVHGTEPKLSTNTTTSLDVVFFFFSINHTFIPVRGKRCSRCSVIIIRVRRKSRCRTATDCLIINYFPTGVYFSHTARPSRARRRWPCRGQS